MTYATGDLLPEKILYVDREKLRKYAEASGDHNPIHLDESFATSVGLPNVIAHGMFTMALAGEAIRLWMGNEWQIVEFSTRFTKPVVVPADKEVGICFSGKITEAHDATISIEVSALSEGVKVLGQTKARLIL